MIESATSTTAPVSVADHTRVACRMTYLETLILQNPFDGRIFTAGHHLGLENDTERPISNDLALCVGDLLHFSGQPILDLFADDLCLVGK